MKNMEKLSKKFLFFSIMTNKFLKSANNMLEISIKKGDVLSENIRYYRTCISNNWSC